MKDADCRFESKARRPPQTCNVRTAADARFAMLDGQPTLFSEASQSLYRLNPVAALIWCCLEGGGDPREAEARLAEAGVADPEARRHVDDAVADWLRLGLVHADFGPTQQRYAYGFRVEDARWRVEATSARLAREIAALFDPDPKEAGEDAQTRLRAMEIGDDIHVYHDEKRAFVGKADEATPMAKSLIIEQVLASHRRDLAFHAACLSRGGRNLLISGEPGAGKSTLSLYLAARGFEYRGDDITLISPDGLARGIACAPTVKSGAWDLVARVRPDLADKPVHHRPDGMFVRYLEPGAADQRADPVAWIVFIKRVAGEGVEVERVDAADSLRRLIEGSTCASGRLSVEGFVALRRLIDGAGSYELTYRNCAEAAEKIVGICDVGA
jgi:hypothetical protein